MFENRSKLKRQIEILAFCLDNKLASNASISYLASEFDVEEITIKRDLSELRTYGIDIHASKHGLKLHTPLTPELVEEIIIHFSSFTYSLSAIDRATSLLVKKFESNALRYIVQIQFCIDNCYAIEVEYNKKGSEVKKILLKPALIFQNEGCWRLMAKDGDLLKQYRLDRFVSVRQTELKFSQVPHEKLSRLFVNAWRTWVSSSQIPVKLQLSKFWTEQVAGKMLIENQKITMNEDGSCIFEAVTNSLEEIAAWIVARGRGCKVLEPEILREKVIQIAKETLSNYYDVARKMYSSESTTSSYLKKDEIKFLRKLFR